MRLSPALARHAAALRAMLVFTVLLGLAYPLAVLAVAQIPGLDGRARGSLVDGTNGQVVGSRLVGQAFTDADGVPLPQYFQSRPSAGGYDPTATGAGNLGPESVVDTLAADPDDAAPSLLTQVCERSLEIGRLDGVSGARPYCSPDGTGAVLGVFRADGLTGRVTRVVALNEACPATPFVATYDGVAVECAQIGADYAKAIVTPIRGNAPADPAVPADAVTASGSGLDPNISPAYADLQAPRIARERGVGVDQVRSLIAEHTQGRTLGILGEPGVDVLQLNLALDRQFPVQS
jgi:potassium-transporting ATPase KdpC subunit